MTEVSSRKHYTTTASAMSICVIISYRTVISSTGCVLMCDVGNGKIDFREFLLLVQNYERPLSEEQEIREMFNAIDTDHNGFIDVDELKSTFSNLGVPLTNSDIRDMLKEANVYGTRIFYEGTLQCHV